MDEETEKQFIDVVESFDEEVEDQQDDWEDIYSKSFKEDKIDKRYGRYDKTLNSQILEKEDLDRIMLS